MPGINLLVVLIAGVASLGLGILWYSRFLFGRKRAESFQIGDTGMDSGMGWGYKLPVMLTAEFAIAYVLAFLIALTGSYSLSALFELIFWIWLGFAAAALLNCVFRERQTWPTYFISISYRLISWMMAGLIIVYLPN